MASVAAAGPIHVEIGDAGDLTGTAQGTGAGVLTNITGNLGANDADMFLINITNPVAFSAYGAGGDTQLFLFDLAGMGVLGNDDAGAGLDAAFPVGSFTGAAGLYYLAISGFDFDPTSVGGLIFPSVPFGPVYGPTGPGGGSPISGWGGGSGVQGAYNISLTGTDSANVPEPLTLSLLGLGLAGLAVRRRRA